jgi:hypothetical protein
MTPRPVASRADRPSLAVAAAAASLGLAGVAVCVLVSDPAGTLVFLVYAGVGGYLASRPAAGRIGWLLVLAGWGAMLGTLRLPFDARLLVEGGYGAREALLGWADATGWALALFAFTGLALVFPAGRLSGGRSGAVARVLLATEAFLALLIAFNPTINVTAAGYGAGLDAPNPLGVVPASFPWSAIPSPDALYPLAFVVFLASAGLLVGRYRRATGLERLQYRWLVAAVAFAASLLLVWAYATYVLGQEATGAANLGAILGFVGVPIAIAVAVLRYRLYAIDRIISRTLGWALVTVFLLAVFTGAVVGLQTVLHDVTQGGTLAVAASTLVAAALFQPVRSRIQRAVDRRFDRARYDAEQTAQRFGARLRGEVAIEAVTADLCSTAGSSLSPSSLDLWLRGPRA